MKNKKSKIIKKQQQKDQINHSEHEHSSSYNTPEVKEVKYVNKKQRLLTQFMVLVSFS